MDALDPDRWCPEMSEFRLPLPLLLRAPTIDASVGAQSHRVNHSDRRTATRASAPRMYSFVNVDMMVYVCIW